MHSDAPDQRNLGFIKEQNQIPTNFNNIVPYINMKYLSPFSVHNKNHLLSM